MLSASLRILSVFVLLLVLSCSASQAQSFHSVLPAPDTSSSVSAASGEGVSSNVSTMGIWIGGSLQPGQFIGKIQKGSFALLGLRFHHLLEPRNPTFSPQGPTLTYTADLFPVSFLTIPPHTIPAPSSDTGEDPIWQKGLKTYGFGGSPLGLRINYRTSKRIQPFLAGSAGFIYFFRSMPDERGKHLNFTIDAGLGVQVALTPRTTLTLGYRYHHLSNGFRGQINPGVDANLLYLGVTLPS